MSKKWIQNKVFQQFPNTVKKISPQLLITCPKSFSQNFAFLRPKFKVTKNPRNKKNHKCVLLSSLKFSPPFCEAVQNFPPSFPFAGRPISLIRFSRALICISSQKWSFTLLIVSFYSPTPEVSQICIVFINLLILMFTIWLIFSLPWCRFTPNPFYLSNSISSYTALW